MMLAPLVPPFRFAAVEENVYRGAYPSLRNMRFLRRLKLSCILCLAPPGPGSGPGGAASGDLAEFCEAEGIRLVYFEVNKYDDSVTMSQSIAAKIVSQMIRPENLPLYVHCRDGGNNTGLIVMCLRRLQNWSLSVIFDEFCRFIKTGEISREECQFVESFRAEIEIPRVIPAWLWQGMRIGAHPTLRLRTAPDVHLLDAPPHFTDAKHAAGAATYVSAAGASSAATQGTARPGAKAGERAMSGEAQVIAGADTREAMKEDGEAGGSLGIHNGDGVHRANQRKAAQAREVNSSTAPPKAFSTEAIQERDRKWAHLMEAFSLQDPKSASLELAFSNNLDALFLDVPVSDRRKNKKSTRIVVSPAIAGLALEGLEM
ncbi:putative tyrosine-protein phosphatase [Porphyridium purpureum]|uniref:Putative tyrosine-protein phosphatase n=1 Tax=Porphyridium purpureum TaxID=35688 RepID=A0A5J4Z5G3_PORPP|nr:putative tyrosine-protein phosphatase [Porphyridium purpureum]|eukprot:POR2839..scf295_1